MKKNLLRSIACSLAMLVGMAAQPARAACCVFDSASIVAAIGASAATIATAIGVQTTLVVSAIAGSAKSSASAIVAGVGKTVSQSAEQVAKSNTETEARLEAERLLRERRITDPCFTVASAMIGPDVERQAATMASMHGRNGGARGSLGRIEDVVAGMGNIGQQDASRSFVARSVSVNGAPISAPGVTLLAVARGEQQAPTPEKLADFAAAFGCDAFAANPERRRMCEAAGIQPRVSNGTPDADVSAGTLLYGPGGSSSARRRTMGGAADFIAMEAYVRNLGTALELRGLSRAELQRDDGRRYLALRDSYEARLSMAEAAWRDRAASMQPLASTSAYLDTLKNDPVAGEYVRRETAGLDLSKGVSTRDLLHLEVGRRSRNPQWSVSLAAKNGDDLLREIAHIGAFNLVLQQQLLEETRDSRLLLAMVSAAQTRQEMQPQLVRQHKLATQ